MREFVAEFRGLTATAVQRKILAEVGCSHQSLRQFFGTNQVNREGIAKLLVAMKQHSKPVNPKHLGIIGADHLRACFLAAGGNAETFKYEQRKGLTENGIPYLIEFAFGLHQSGLEERLTRTRQIVTGANWSVSLGNPFRNFGSTVRAGNDLNQGARQHHGPGGLRAASSVGLCAIRGPRQKLNHSHRQREATR